MSNTVENHDPKAVDEATQTLAKINSYMEELTKHFKDTHVTKNDAIVTMAYLSLHLIFSDSDSKEDFQRNASNFRDMISKVESAIITDVESSLELAKTEPEVVKTEEVKVTETVVEVKTEEVKVESTNG